MDKLSACVLDFLKKYKINNNILVAFSGGYDSMCLLNILVELGFSPIAIHLNHNWRGEESLQEEENCRKFCKAKNIEFYTETLDKSIQATETVAREMRYKFFKSCAEKFNSKVILTAHNADDNVETLIYRIAKGTGIEGLKGISPVRDIYYRPLLTIYRSEIENYCREHNLTPNNDSSNKNPKYSRNRIRLNILPELEKIKKNVKFAINTLSENAWAESEIIHEYLQTLKDKFKTSNFIKFSPAVQNRIIYEFLIENNFEYDKIIIKKIIDFINKNAHLKNGKTLSIGDNRLLFVNRDEIRLVVEATSKCTTIKIEICTEMPEKFPPDSDFIAYVDLSKVGENLILRKRQDGDIIQPLGMTGSLKLKKYLNAKGIAKDKRDEMLFLCLNNETLWIPGVGLSEKIKVSDKPTHILRLERE